VRLLHVFPSKSAHVPEGIGEGLRGCLRSVLSETKKHKYVWINIIRWVEFVEQSLFLGTGQERDGDGGSADAYLSCIRRTKGDNGKWMDFSFAQRMLKFLDRLLELSQVGPCGREVTALLLTPAPSRCA